MERRWRPLFTVPMTPRVDFNPAVRLLVPTVEGGETLLGLQAGFGMRTGRRFIPRPEAALIFDPGEDGVLWTFGLGVSLR